MKKPRIQKVANLALFSAIIGVFVTFPFYDTFIGGLLFALFSAAAIGGLADSFAVSAIFGQPLGIRWPNWMGTRIIEKNKARLIDELVTMVQDELLTLSNIQSKLAEYNVANVLMVYLQKHGGKQQLNEIMHRFVADIVNKIDVPELANAISDSLPQYADSIQASELIADIGQWTIDNGYDDRMMEFVTDELIKWVESYKFRSIMKQLTQSAIASYEGGKFRRQLIDSFAGIDADNISLKIQEWLIRLLRELTAPEHVYRQQFKSYIQSLLIRLKTDDELRERIELAKMKLVRSLSEQFQLDIYIRETLEPLQQAAVMNDNGQHTELFPWLHRWIEQAITALENNPNTLQSIDQSIKTSILTMVNKYQYSIGSIVAEQLHSYDDKKIIALAKEKAGHDLQYVRLNGIGVGALVGVLLFLSTFWIGG